MFQTSPQTLSNPPALTVIAGTTVEPIPWVKLLQSAVWCSNVAELTEHLEAAEGNVLDSIEALSLVQTDTLGEVFRLRELATA
jgi:hypothetical protein